MIVENNDVRLFFDVINAKLEIDGAGLGEKPVLLCLPGGPGGDHQTLRPFFDRFAGVAQVVYFDPRGGGRSEHGDPSRWTLDQWGDDIAAFCDLLGIEKPIVLGVSGGSLMVQAYLARHPRHAGGAVLINACSRMVQEGIIAAYEKAGGPEAAAAAQAMYDKPGPEDYAVFFKHCLPHFSVKRDLSSLSASRGRVRLNSAATERFSAPVGEAWRFDFRGRLGEVECPVLVAIGEHDPVTPAVWGREVADALPPGRAELLAFPDASHLIAADEPDRLTRAIEDFVRGGSN
jgi:proline iminopeptidase